MPGAVSPVGDAGRADSRAVSRTHSSEESDGTPRGITTNHVDTEPGERSAIAPAHCPHTDRDAPNQFHTAESERVRR